MIQLDRDGVTLFYIDANGQRVAHNYIEGAAYSDMLIILGAQQQVARENTQALANYNSVVENIKMNIELGKAGGMKAPVKPLKKAVSDTGEVTLEPFVPALVDVVIPVTGEPHSAVHGLVNTDLPRPIDQQTIMFNMISALFRKAFPDA